MKFKGAIFDMDGTIVDSLMFWDHLWQRIGEAYLNDSHFQPTVEVDKKVRTMIFADAMRFFQAYYAISADTEEFLRFTAAGVKNFYKDVVKPKAGAKEFLTFLKENNVKLCLASATAMPEIRFALECYDMLRYFDGVLSCADLGVGKDRPDIYLQAQELLGLPARDICVFEDSYVALETAKRVGFQTVGIYDAYNFEQERLKKSSDVYLDQSQTLKDLIVGIHL